MWFDTDVLTRLQGVMDRFAPLVGILGGTEKGDLDEARAACIDYLANELTPLNDVRIAEAVGGPCPTLLVGGEAELADRLILYTHGGGYASGGPAMYRRLAGKLATLTGAQVFVSDYRPAPEHPFPAPIDDVAATYCWLLG